MSKFTFSLDADQEAFVNERVAGGQYEDAGDYLRELVRQDQAYARKLTDLRQAIQDGIDSGISNRTAEQIWENARQRHRAKRA